MDQGRQAPTRLAPDDQTTSSRLAWPCPTRPSRWDPGPGCRVPGAGAGAVRCGARARLRVDLDSMCHWRMRLVDGVDRLAIDRSYMLLYWYFSFFFFFWRRHANGRSASVCVPPGRAFPLPVPRSAPDSRFQKSVKKKKKGQAWCRRLIGLAVFHVQVQHVTIRYSGHLPHPRNHHPTTYIHTFPSISKRVMPGVSIVHDKSTIHMNDRESGPLFVKALCHHHQHYHHYCREAGWHAAHYWCM